MGDRRAGSGGGMVLLFLVLLSWVLSEDGLPLDYLDAKELCVLF